MEREINTHDELYHDNPRMLRIHEDSGNFCTNNPLVALLYRLMRDEVTPGVMEGIVQEVLDHNESKEEDICFTNGWLAAYAENILGRLSE